LKHAGLWCVNRLVGAAKSQTKKKWQKENLTARKTRIKIALVFQGLQELGDL